MTPILEGTINRNSDPIQGFTTEAYRSPALQSALRQNLAKTTDQSASLSRTVCRLPSELTRLTSMGVGDADLMPETVDDGKKS